MHLLLDIKPKRIANRSDSLRTLKNKNSKNSNKISQKSKNKLEMEAEYKEMEDKNFSRPTFSIVGSGYEEDKKEENKSQPKERIKNSNIILDRLIRRVERGKEKARFNELKDMSNTKTRKKDRSTKQFEEPTSGTIDHYNKKISGEVKTRGGFERLHPNALLREQLHREKVEHDRKKKEAQEFRKLKKKQKEIKKQNGKTPIETQSAVADNLIITDSGSFASAYGGDTVANMFNFLNATVSSPHINRSIEVPLEMDSDDEVPDLEDNIDNFYRNAGIDPETFRPNNPEPFEPAFVDGPLGNWRRRNADLLPDYVPLLFRQNGIFQGHHGNFQNDRIDTIAVPAVFSAHGRADLLRQSIYEDVEPLQTRRHRQTDMSASFYYEQFDRSCVSYDEVLGTAEPSIQRDPVDFCGRNLTSLTPSTSSPIRFELPTFTFDGSCLTESGSISDVDIKLESGISDFIDSKNDLLKEAIEKLCSVFNRVDALHSLMLPMSAYLYQLYRSRTALDGVVASVQFVNAVYPEGNEAFVRFTKSLYEYLPVFSIFSDQNNEIHTESLSDGVQEVQVTLNRLLSSELVTALRTIVLSAASFKFFDKDVAQKMFQMFGKPEKKMSIIEVLDSVISQLVSLLRVGENYIAGSSIKEILLAADPIVEFNRAAYDILAYEGRIYVGMPVFGKMNQMEFARRVKELIETGEKLKSKCNRALSTSKTLCENLNKLYSAAITIRTSMNTGMRPTPYGIAIIGPPGIGKANLVNYFASIVTKVLGFEYSPTMMYHKSNTSDYWEPLDPVSQVIAHFSEIGSTASTIAKVKGDPVSIELTSIIDQLPHPVDMAFGDKGKVFANFCAVIADSNIKRLGFDDIVKNPSAYLRRFIFIEPMLKPEYRAMNGIGIDKKKALAVGGLDLWTFKVYRYSVQGNNTDREEIVMNHNATDDIYAVTQYLFADIEDHFRMQDELVTKVYSCKVDDYMVRPDNNEFKDNTIVTQAGAEAPPMWREPIDQGQARRNRLYHQLLQQRAWVEPVIVQVKNIFDNMFKLFLWMYVWYGETAYETFIIIPEAWFTAWIAYSVYCFFTCFTILWLIFTPHIFFFVIFRWVLPTAIRELFKSFLKSRIRLYASRLVPERIRHYWDALRYHLGINKIYNIAESSWWRKNGELVLSGAATLAAMIAVYKFFHAPAPKKVEDKEYYTYCDDCEKDIVVEAHTTFVEETKYNEEINNFEELVGCGRSSKRIPIKDTKLWNNIELEVSPCIFTGKPSELERVIGKNVRLIRVETKLPRKGHVLGLYGNVCVVNTHTLGFEGNPRVGISNTCSTHKDDNICFKYTQLSELSRVDLPNDLSILLLNDIIFRDIRHHLSNDLGFGGSLDSRLNGEDFRASLMRPSSALVDKHGSETHDVNIDTLWVYHLKHNFPGLCGMPLISRKSHGSCIMGIHVGSDKNSSFATPLPKDILLKASEDLLSKSPFVRLHSEGNIHKYVTGEDPAKKSPIRYIPLHGIRGIGRTESRVLINQKSKLTTTLFSGELDRVFLQHYKFTPSVLYKPPLMAPCFKDGEYVSPYNIALSTISAQKLTCDQTISKRIIEEISGYVIGKLKKRNVTIAPLTLECAINGVLEDPFIRRINTSTSAAFGNPGLKRDYLPIMKEDPDYVYREPVPNLKGQVLEMLKTYSMGDNFGIVNKMQLKDEPREASKVDAGKTRPFYMTPLPFLVVCRMFLATLYSQMVESSFDFCCAVGTNMHSDASKIVNHLREFNEKIIQGDFSGFDQSMPFDIGHIANSIIYNILKEFGYNGEALTIVRGILTDTLFPAIEVLNDLFIAAGLQPSGMFATAENNGLRCLVIMMFVFYSDERHSHLSFFDVVRPITYGDDFVSSVKDEVIDTYNNITFKNICESKIGLKFTSPSKSEQVLKYVDIHDCEFLKRKFLFREDYNRWVAQLDINSLYKSLYWTLPSKVVPPCEQVRGAITSVLWESVLYFDKNQFDAFAEELSFLYSHHYLGGADCVFPQYDEIVEAMFA